VVQVKLHNALGGLGGLIGREELKDAAWKKLSDIPPINHIKPGAPPFSRSMATNM